MIVETDFTTKQHILVFEKRRINLDRSESREFDLWLEQKLIDNAVIDSQQGYRETRTEKEAKGIKL